MSTLAQFLRPTLGNLTHNPHKLSWHVGKEDNFGLGFFGDSTGGAAYRVNFFDDAATWVILDAWADTATHVDTTDDDDYKGVTDYTGSGVLTNIILPGVTALGDVVTAKVTVDGAEYEIAFTAEDDAKDRFCSGKVMQHSDYGSRGESSTVWGDSGIVSGIACRHTRTTLTQGYSALCTPSNTLSGAPCLRFETSLVVEMKCSDVCDTDERDRCAVVYFIDQ